MELPELLFYSAVPLITIIGVILWLFLRKGFSPIQLDWDDSLITGDKTVDDQHRILFSRFCELEAAIRGQLDDEIIQSLVRKVLAYTVEHFDDEEALMERAGYPWLHEHCQRHRELGRNALQLCERWELDHEISAEQFTRYLRLWISNHVHTTDKPMIQWLQNHQKAPLHEVEQETSGED